MSCGRAPLEYRRLRAPDQSQTALVEPPLGEVAAMLAANSQRRRLHCYNVQGRCLSELTRQAREELLRAALSWTSTYRDVTAAIADPGAPFFLAGHQPQLFHPGVWFKNYALGSVARIHGAVAINLVIDSDTMKTNTVRVPGGSRQEPVAVAVPLDVAGQPVPFEERTIADHAMFKSFGQRALTVMRPLLADSMLSEFWPAVCEQAGRTANLGYSLASARHRSEARWGSPTLELPQSRVSSLDAHLWFAAHLLAELPRFRRVYNEVVDEYRQIHHVRSRSHPVPDLGAEGEWIEAPFWVWSETDPRRRKLFAARRGEAMVLADRHGWEARIDLSPQREAGVAVDQLREIARGGVKIRSRALITTLWARLVLGDLFIHGIGGAKYDQLTDAIIERFFGMEPPGYMVVSATLRLPLERPPATAAGAVRHGLRELRWHPEHYLGDAVADPAVAARVAEKRRWVSVTPTPENAAERFRAIRRLNGELERWTAASRERLRAELARSQAASRAAAILGWREYAFCLFPESTLQEAFARWMPPAG